MCYKKNIVFFIYLGQNVFLIVVLEKGYLVSAGKSLSNGAFGLSRQQSKRTEKSRDSDSSVCNLFVP